MNLPTVPRPRPGPARDGAKLCARSPCRRSRCKGHQAKGRGRKPRAPLPRHRSEPMSAASLRMRAGPRTGPVMVRDESGRCPVMMWLSAAHFLDFRCWSALVRDESHKLLYWLSFLPHPANPASHARMFAGPRTSADRQRESRKSADYNVTTALIVTRVSRTITGPRTITESVETQVGGWRPAAGAASIAVLPAPRVTDRF